MNWALRQRLESHQQQILLYVIADSADPNGTTRHCDPEYMAEHARMTRATMFRRLGEIEGLGLLKRFKFYTERGAPIYEIRLDLALLIDLPIKRRKGTEDDPADDETEAESRDGTSRPESQAETLPQSHAETMVATIVSPSAAPQSQSCDYISPTLPKEDSPPYPPPGGAVSREEGEASRKRDALWQRFVQGYPGITTMDQREARDELDALTLDDAEWAVSVLPALKEDLRKARDRPPKNAHIWLKKGMFRNFTRVALGRTGSSPELLRYASDGAEGTALIALHAIGRAALYDSGTVDYAGEITAQILAFAKAGRPSEWRFTDEPRHIAAWTEFIGRAVHRARASMAVTQGLGASQREGIKVPWPFPPSKDGVIYDWPQEPEPPPDSGEPPP